MKEPDPATAEFPKVERRGRGRGLYNADRHPRQRMSDHGWRYWSVWAYRMILPAVAVIIAAFAVTAAHDATVKANHNAQVAKAIAAQNRRALIAIQDGRRAAIRESCNQDETLADVVRRAILGFGVGGGGSPAPPGVTKAFEPLGGLRPLTKAEKQRRCDARVRRGAGP
jgi:hypothetical protein